MPCPTIDITGALRLVKARLNRLDNTLDDYLTHRILAAVDDLTGRGIHLGARPGDQMLIVDFTVWAYGSRGQQGAMPDWLRWRLRNRWLEERGQPS